jgi:hypothetical protein
VYLQVQKKKTDAGKKVKTKLMPNINTVPAWSLKTTTAKTAFDAHIV